MVEHDETLSAVIQFHRTFGCAVQENPGLPDLTGDEVYRLDLLCRLMRTATDVCHEYAEQLQGRGSQVLFTRLQLIQEELSELAEAMRDRDALACLDGLTDLQYVLDGTYAALGLQDYKLAAFREVHESNMSKLGEDGRPLLSAAGRVIKGPFFRPPDLRRVLREGR